MSDDLSAIHAQTSAILEKLYDQKGQPEELDESFHHEYLKLVSEQVKVGDEAEEAALRGPHSADVKLSRSDGGLIEVNIPSKSKKVSGLESSDRRVGCIFHARHVSLSENSQDFENVFSGEWPWQAHTS